MVSIVFAGNRGIACVLFPAHTVHAVLHVPSDQVYSRQCGLDASINHIDQPKVHERSRNLLQSLHSIRISEKWKHHSSETILPDPFTHCFSAKLRGLLLPFDVQRGSVDLPSSFNKFNVPTTSTTSDALLHMLLKQFYLVICSNSVAWPLKVRTWYIFSFRSAPP
jgi:hypothetical protein